MFSFSHQLIYLFVFESSFSSLCLFIAVDDIDEDLKAFNCNLSRGIDSLFGSFEGVALDLYLYFLRKKFCIILLFIYTFLSHRQKSWFQIESF
jgi:hypothetical protein